MAMNALINVINAPHVPENVKIDVNIANAIGGVANYVYHAWNRVHGVVNITSAVDFVVNLVIDQDVINHAEKCSFAIISVLDFAESHVQRIVEYVMSKRSPNFFLVTKKNHMLNSYF